MLLMGMKMSLTKNPMKPITTNPSAVLIDTFENSVHQATSNNIKTTSIHYFPDLAKLGFIPLFNTQTGYTNPITLESSYTTCNRSWRPPRQPTNAIRVTTSWTNKQSKEKKVITCNQHQSVVLPIWPNWALLLCSTQAQWPYNSHKPLVTEAGHRDRLTMPSGLQHHEEQRNCGYVENTSTIWLVASLHKADAVLGELLHGPHNWVYGLHNFLNKSTTSFRKHRTNQCNAMRARCMNAGSLRLTESMRRSGRVDEWTGSGERGLSS